MQTIIALMNKNVIMLSNILYNKTYKHLKYAFQTIFVYTFFLQVFELIYRANRGSVW